MKDYWTPEDDAKGTDVDRWLELYAKDDNNFWRSASGHHQNVIDELIDRLEQADKRAEERILERLQEHSPHRYYVGDNTCKGCELLPMELVCGCCHQNVHLESTIKGENE